MPSARTLALLVAAVASASGWRLSERRRMVEDVEETGVPQTTEKQELPVDLLHREQRMLTTVPERVEENRRPVPGKVGEPRRKRGPDAPHQGYTPRDDAPPPGPVGVPPSWQEMQRRRSW